MNKIFFLLCLLFIISIPVSSQINLEYGTVKKCGGILILNDSISYVLNVGKLNNKTIDSFLTLSTITSIKRNGSPKIDSLKKQLGITRSPSDLNKLLQTGKIEKLPLTEIIDLEAGDSIFIHPYLGKDSNGKPLVADKEGCGFKIIDSSSIQIRNETTDNCDSIRFVDDSMLPSFINPSDNPHLTLKNVFNCLKKRSEKHLVPDYLILYDYKTGNYFSYKRKLKKTDANDPCAKLGSIYKEYFQYVKGAWFTPSVGSQFKFEVVNKPIQESLKIEATYYDLFLEQSTSFESLLNGRINAALFPSADTSKKDTTINPQAKKLTQEDCDSILLVRLNNDLLNYASSFQLSSYTYDLNAKNLSLILQRIKATFKFKTNNVLNELRDRFKDRATLLTLVENIITTFNSIQNAKPLFFSTVRLRNKDYLNVKVKNSTNEVLKDDNVRLGYGLKIDFSGGVFLTGLKDYTYIFKDTTLKYRPVDSLPSRDTSGRMIIREKDNRVNVGFGLLTHVYPRFTSSYNIGVTCGFMSTTNLDLNILLGGSMMFSSIFGSNMRVTFSGGIVWGKADRLSNAYYEGYKEVNDKPVFYPTTLSVPPVTKVWNRSWFFGMTFNFNSQAR